MSSAIAKLLILSLVVVSVPEASRAFALTANRARPALSERTDVIQVSHTPHHKHHNRNFYGKHYDPWAHSKGSH
jgi:hypothetical protein